MTACPHTPIPSAFAIPSLHELTPASWFSLIVAGTTFGILLFVALWPWSRYPESLRRMWRGNKWFVYPIMTRLERTLIIIALCLLIVGQTIEILVWIPGVARIQAWYEVQTNFIFQPGQNCSLATIDQLYQAAFQQTHVLYYTVQALLLLAVICACCGGVLNYVRARRIRRGARITSIEYDS